MLSWPDFDIMSFGCSYSMNMYLCILGLAFFTAGLFLAQDYYHYDCITYNQVHTPMLQPTHWASINSAIASTQSSVYICTSGNDTYNSCIMYPSDFPDMHTHALGPLYVHPSSRAVRPESVGVHIRQITRITRAHDTTDMYHVG